MLAKSPGNFGGQRNSGMKSLVNWPGIIKHSHDAELIFVRDQSGWETDADIHAFEYDRSDCLIDATGNIYTLTCRNNKQVIPQASGDSMPLEKILGLVKAHAAQQNACCVAKIYAPTIQDAFKIIEALNEA